jgi:hypothetical protein
MLFSSCRYLFVPLALLSFVSCGSESAHRPLNAKKTLPKTEPVELSAVMPRYLLARVATMDLDSNENSAVDFVTVSGDVKIANGEDAAVAFAAGESATKPGNQLLSLSSDQEIKFDLGMPAQIPVQMGDPCDPCAKSKGQIYKTPKGKTRGYLAKSRRLLRQMKPIAQKGEQTIPYNYENQFSSGDNSYVVYGQAQMPFQPVQYQYQQTGNQQAQNVPAVQQPPTRLNGN